MESVKAVHNSTPDTCPSPTKYIPCCISLPRSMPIVSHTHFGHVLINSEASCCIFSLGFFHTILLGRSISTFLFSYKAPLKCQCLAPAYNFHDAFCVHTGKIWHSLFRLLLYVVYIFILALMTLFI